MAISLVLFTTGCNAIEIDIQSPQEAQIEEEIEISVSISPEETYDLKVYIGEPVKTVSEILINGVWKSPFNYLKEAYPSKKSFIVRAHSMGESKICVRIRKPSDSKFEEKCETIKIIESSNSQSEEERDKSSESKEEKDEKTDSQTKVSLMDDISIPEKRISENISLIQENSSENQEPILLSYKPSDNQSMFYSRDYIKKMSIFYGLTIFSILLVVLIALRKL